MVKSIIFPLKHNRNLRRPNVEFEINNAICEICPYVIKMYDYKQILIKSKNCVCIELLMEYGGRDLESTEITFSELLCGFYQLIIAIQRMHGIGLIHCDIKPANLIWDEKKAILKLVDFGSAFYTKDSLIYDPVMGKYNCKLSSFTRMFAPPEILLYDKKKYNVDSTQYNKIDIYCFGATLLAMLLKFRNKSLSSTDIKNYDERVEPLDHLVVEQNIKETLTELGFSNFCEIISQCMCYDPVKRWDINILEVKYKNLMEETKNTYIIEHIQKQQIDVFTNLVKAKKYESFGEYNEAKFLYEIALSTSNLPQMSDLFINVWIGRNFKMLGHYKAAMKFLKNAYKKCENLHGECSLIIIEIYLNIADIYLYKGKNDYANEYYAKVLEDLEKCKSKFNELHISIMKARIYNSLGILMRNIGKFQESIEILEKSLEMRLKIFKENSIEISETYNNLSSAYLSINDQDKAIEYSEKSAEIICSINENLPQLGIIYMNLGTIYMSKSYFSLAQNYYEQALEKLPKVFGVSNLQFASFFNNMGYRFYKAGFYSSAIELIKKIENIYNLIKQNDINDGESLENAKIYNNLAAIFNEMGDYKTSIEYYKKSIEIKKKYFPENLSEIAIFYNNIATAYMKNKEFEKAIKSQKIAIQIYEKSLEKNYKNLAISYNNLASYSYELKEFDNALNYGNIALNMIKNFIKNEDDFFILADCYKNLAIINSELSNSIETENYGKKACELYEKYLQPNDTKYISLYNVLGVLNLRKQNNVEAAKNFENAIKIYEQNKQNFTSNLTPLIYYHLGLAKYRLFEYSDAIKFLEKANKTTNNDNSKLKSQIYKEIGNANINLSHFNEAKISYEKCIEILKKEQEKYKENNEINKEIVELQKTIEKLNSTNS